MSITQNAPPNVSVVNRREKVYLKGSEDVDGSLRFAINSDTGFAAVEKRSDGLWQLSSFQAGGSSVYVGLRVGIAAAGHHIMTKDTDGHYHFHSHSKFDGETSQSDARIIKAIAFLSRDVAQPLFSGEFIGESLGFTSPTTQHSLIKITYFKAGSVAATKPVRYQIWEGTDETGTKIFDQIYPPALFPAATTLTSGLLTVGTWYILKNYVTGDDFTNVGAASNTSGIEFQATGTTPTVWTNASTLDDSDIKTHTDGFVELDNAKYYHLKLSSSATFSVKTHPIIDFPWIATDTCTVEEQDMLQTPEWITGGTFTAGQWSIQNNKIYVCNTTGIQTGTFTSNIALWDVLGSGSDIISEINTAIGNTYWQEPPISRTNPLNFAYIRGDATTEGSIRFSVDGNSDIALIEKLDSGVWNKSSIKAGGDTLWVGENVGIQSVGHHIATESSEPNHLHFHANSEFNGQISTSDTKIVNAYSYSPKLVFQADESGSFTGTSFSYTIAPFSNIIARIGYIKTGLVAATSNIKIQIWEGTDDTGTLIHDQSYPYSDFTANTEVGTLWRGYLEFTKGTNYFIKYSSDANFSLKTNATNTIPWLAGDVSLVREDDILQTTEWLTGETFTQNQWTIQNNKIYECNTTGTQATSFATNPEKWNELSPSIYSWETVKSNTAIRIPENHQMSVHDTFSMNGDLILEGTLILRN